MNKKILLIIMAVLLLAVFFGGTVFFYSTPYFKGKNCIAYLNKNGIDNCGESEWISMSDLELMQIVENDIFLQDNRYVVTKIRGKTEWNTLTKICVSYDVTAKVMEWDSYTEIKEYQGQIVVDFVFSNFEWRVESVKTQSKQVGKIS